MALRSLANIRDDVRFRGDFRNTVRFPDANVNSEIQSAFAEFYELVADTNEGYWDTTGDVTTSIGVGFVALPSDAWRVRAIDRLDASGAVDGQLCQIGIDERNRYGNGSINEAPRAYRLTARGADLFPTPDAVYTLRVTYTPLAPTLSAAREFYNGWDEYVIYATLIRLSEGQERDTSMWQSRVDRQAMRIKSAASGRRQQEPERIPLHDGPGTYFDEGWR